MDAMRDETRKADLISKELSRNYFEDYEDCDSNDNCVHFDNCDDFDYSTNIINCSTSIFEQWSNKNYSKVIFDSKFDGDGSKNVLSKRVYKKSNLYFIVIDDSNNIFGGYVSVKIGKYNDYIKDKNSFVFSLVRGDKMKKSKYNIKPSYIKEAFTLFNYDQYDALFKFNDIYVKPINNSGSWCRCDFYDYKNVGSPLIDMTSQSVYFQAKRIIVVQMN
ncbi:TLDc domain-containing protein [Entamoeba marina]